jgi:two-component system NtrC family response regulator
MEQVFTHPHLGPTCFAIHLPEKFRIQQARAGVKSKNSLAKSMEKAGKIMPTWSAYKQKCELDYLSELRLAAGGNVTEAARISQISRTRLYQLLEKYHLSFS